MSDPNPPTDATTETDDPVEPAPARLPSRYRRERMAVAVLFFALVGFIIVHGAIQIHADTFRPAASASPWPRCSDGLAALYARYAADLDLTADGRPRAPGRGATLDALDQQLASLRPVCDREGTAAHDAYNSLTLWRHKTEDLSGLAARTLLTDAERALRYRSPGTAPEPSTDPNSPRGNDR